MAVQKTKLQTREELASKDGVRELQFIVIVENYFVRTYHMCLLLFSVFHWCDDGLAIKVDEP